MALDKYRNIVDGNIDLIRAYEEENNKELSNEAINYIRKIESYRLIKSQQVAAVILANIEFMLIK